MGGHRISPPVRPEGAPASSALTIEAAWRLGLKTSEEAMEILEAFDATRLVARRSGARRLRSHDGRARVRAREDAGGGLPVHVRCVRGKIGEWVARSRGNVRADVCHEKLVAMGYQGSERTTRRAVAEATRRWRAEHGRRTRPWSPEPGLCGCTGITATGRRSPGGGRCCSARGCLGARSTRT